MLNNTYVVQLNLSEACDYDHNAYPNCFQGFLEKFTWLSILFLSFSQINALLLYVFHKNDCSIRGFDLGSYAQAIKYFIANSFYFPLATILFISN